MKHFIYFISAVIFISCSTKKDRFLNRNYHALVTKYNVLYNSNVAYEKGLKQVEDTYNDDFTQVLPIEPFSFYAEEYTDTDAAPIGQSNFEKAEEKAVKSIQKHSMHIDGEEKNFQIDEAYLLLGKSRYYTKRFTPALEAFEYIIKNYPTASLIYETVVWRAKSNIHIGNVDFGKRSLLRLLTSTSISNEVRQQSEIGVVMAYEKTPDSINQKIAHLKASLKAVNKGVVASRAAFVLGQLYRKRGDIDSADIAFDKVIENKQGLYKYKLQAQIEKINNHIEDYNTQQFLEELDHLIFVRKNRPYVNKLLFQKGLVYEKADSIKLAKKFYTQSVQESEEDVHQKMIAYEQLGNLSYTEKDYTSAKSYYDSLIDVSRNKKSLRVARIQRKSNSLNKIVNTIKMAKSNDSLLKIASLTEDELNQYYQNYIDKIKEQERVARIKELKKLAAQNQLANNQASGGWYFFNRNAKDQGRVEFQEKWGNIKRRPNWYISSGVNNAQETIENPLEGVVVTSSEYTKYDVAYYTTQINRSPRFLAETTKNRNLNYYELGNVYYSQLNEKDLAINKLEQLIDFKPAKELKMGAYYRLYRIYQDVEDNEGMAVYKSKLENEFPNSSFTKMINNITSTENELEPEDEYVKCYETIYELYQLKSYQAALEEVENARAKYANTNLAPKYDLLHAYIVAKVKGKKDFYKLLNDIKLSYPGTEQAKKADEFLNNN